MFIASLQEAFAKRETKPDPITAAVSAAKQANEVAVAKLKEAFNYCDDNKQKPIT